MNKVHIFFFLIIILNNAVIPTRLKLSSYLMMSNYQQDNSTSNFKYLQPQTNIEIEDKPVYLTSWAKYFAFQPTITKNDTLFARNSTIDYLSSSNLKTSDSTETFYKNRVFFDQWKTNKTVNLTIKDKVGYVNNPSENSFFFILTRKNINVLTSRKAENARTIDLISLEDILSEELSKNFVGGITDSGDYEEGYCIEIKTKIGKSFTICFENQNQKLDWLNTLVRLIAKVKNRSIALNNSSSNSTNSTNTTASSLIKVMKNMQDSIFDSIGTNEEFNGKWIAVSPWSECSSPCGGGKSFLRRVCLLPDELEASNKLTEEELLIKQEQNKKLCNGEALVTKDCNLQPCGNTRDRDIFSKSLGISSSNSPNLSQLNAQDSSINPNTQAMQAQGITNQVILKPQFKFLPVSSKPLRYEKCVIKEGDLALLVDSGNLKGAKIPVRVLLNSQTLSVYSSDDYKSIITSVLLSKITSIKALKTDSSCFEVIEGTKATTLCAFVSQYKSLKDLSTEWKEDILFFVRKCSKIYSKSLDLNPENENLEDNALDFYAKKQQEDIEKIISRTQTLAISALEKELKVEEIIEKEEDEKESSNQEKWKKELEITNKQKEMVQKQLEKKRKEAALYAKKLALRKKIEEIKSQVQEQINKVRGNLKQRLLIKKKDDRRKKDLYIQKISEIKNEISQNLLKASKEGDSDKCDPERPSKFIVNYCKENFSIASKQNECVKNDNYCYYCCENEFGELHFDERANCSSKCEDFYTKKIKFKHNKDDNSSENTSIENAPKDTNLKNAKPGISNSNSDNKNSTLTQNNTPRFKSMMSEADKNQDDSDSFDIQKQIEETKKTELLKIIKETLG